MQPAIQHPQQPPRCDCTEQAVRWRTQSNGVLVCVLQCQCCGRQIRAISKQSAEAVNAPRVPFDEGLRAEWDALVSAFYTQRREQLDQQREAKDQAWWDRYNAYLNSPAWQERRRAVFERDNWTCQGCLKNRATQVHHRNYKQVGQELLFDLVSICDACHDRAHGGAAW